MANFRNAILIAILSAQVFASDWPGWRGPNRDGKVPAGVAVPTKLPEKPAVVWKIPVGSGFASPVVQKNVVYYLDFADGKEVVHAASATNGKELWKTPLDDPHKDGFGIGPRCTPTVDGEFVFVQSCKGEFKCLTAADGKEVWRKNFVTDFGAIYIGEKGQAAGASRHGADGAPLIDGENVIALVGSAKDASVVCFKKSDGTQVWASQTDQSAYAPPVIETVAGVRQLLVFTAVGLIGLNPNDGKLLWRVPLKTALGRHVTTPVVVNDTVFVASHQVGLCGVKVSREGPSGFKADLAIQLKELPINFSSPVAVNGYLYGVVQNKIVCINAADGKVAWEKPREAVWGADGMAKSSADRVYASFMVMNDNVFMLTDVGDGVLFAADPKDYREVNRVKLCDFNWCNPAYADGKLFLRDKTELLCVELLK